MEERIREYHKAFIGSFSEEDFEKLFGFLTQDDQARFANASLTYKKAMRCKECDSDVCLALLCSTADAVGNHLIKGSHNRFKKFLGEYCPERLRNPPLTFYGDFTPPEDYKRHQTPDEICKRLKASEPVMNSFERALDFVYSRFRCYFLHEAVGLVGIPHIGNSYEERIEAFLSPTFDFNYEKSPAAPVRIDHKVVDWFSNVVKESLVQYLLTRSHDK